MFVAVVVVVWAKSTAGASLTKNVFEKPSKMLPRNLKISMNTINIKNNGRIDIKMLTIGVKSMLLV
jgi:hypothetical protein